MWQKTGPCDGRYLPRHFQALQRCRSMLLLLRPQVHERNAEAFVWSMPVSLFLLKSCCHSVYVVKLK